MENNLTIPKEMSLFNSFYYGNALDESEMKMLKGCLERGLKQIEQNLKELQELKRWEELGRRYGELHDGDIVYVSYGNEVPEGFYEVSFTVNGSKECQKSDIMWIRNDRDGCYNMMEHEAGTLKLIAPAQYRFDKGELQ